MSLEETKENLNRISMRLNANEKKSYGNENQNDMMRIRDKEVNNNSE